MIEAAEKSGGKRPLGVYAVPEQEKEGEKRRFWPKIGVAFVNRDGSLTLLLDSLPLGTNKLQVREQKDDLRAAHGGPPRRNGFEVHEVRP